MKKKTHVWPLTKAATLRRRCKLEMKGKTTFLTEDFKIRFMPFRGY